jgi:hypothetical protein
MQKIENFWSAIEKMPALKGIKAHWQEYAGLDYPLMEMILRPTAQQSFAYPCHMPKECYYPRMVIKEEASLYAICSNYPRRCEKVSLQNEDVIVYECDYPKLSRIIADAIGAHFIFSPTEYPFTFRIGTKNISVYLALVNDSAQLANIITGIYASIKAPFILLFPTPSLISHSVEALCRATGCIGMALSESIGKCSSGKLVALCSIRDALLNNAKSNPFPDGAAWHDIKMQFRDGHTISITCKSIQIVANFTQLGMVNTKNGEPTKQWQLLKILGESEGKLSWKNSAANERWQKQKGLLSKNLQDYFGINDDPIVWDSSERCYRTKFSILAEGD